MPLRDEEGFENVDFYKLEGYLHGEELSFVAQVQNVSQFLLKPHCCLAFYSHAWPVEIPATCNVEFPSTNMATKFRVVP